MVKEDIQTVIDRLADYIAASGSVSLKDAAKAVARKPAQVERFALLLEEAGLIDVHYSISGIRLVSKKKPSVQKQELGDKDEGTSAIEEVSRLEREILTTENLLRFFETDIERRIHVSEKLLADLESREGFTAEELDRLRTEVDLALQQLESFSAEVRKLGERETEFYSKLKGFRSRIDHIEARATSAPRKGRSGIIDFLLNLLDIILIVKKPGAASKPATEPKAGPDEILGEKPEASGEKPGEEKPKQTLAPVTATARPETQKEEEAPASSRKLPMPFKLRPGSKSGSVRKRFVIKRRGR